MTTQFNVRLPDPTIARINQLVESYGSQSKTIIAAVENLQAKDNQMDAQKLFAAISSLPTKSNELAASSSKIAAWVASQMAAAGVRDLLDGKLAYRECRANVGVYDTLTIEGQDVYGDHCSSGDLMLGKLGGQASDGFYMYGDFNHWVSYPSRSEVEAFLESIPAILEELAALAETPEVPAIPQ